MTVNEYVKTLDGNNTEAARRLNVARNTIFKYKKDIEGKEHFIIQMDGEFCLFARLGGKGK